MGTGDATIAVGGGHSNRGAGTPHGKVMREDVIEIGGKGGNHPVDLFDLGKNPLCKAFWGKKQYQ